MSNIGQLIGGGPVLSFVHSHRCLVQTHQEWTNVTRLQSIRTVSLCLTSAKLNRGELSPLVTNFIESNSVPWIHVSFDFHVRPHVVAKVLWAAFHQNPEDIFYVHGEAFFLSCSRISCASSHWLAPFAEKQALPATLQLHERRQPLFWCVRGLNTILPPLSCHP